MFPNDRFLNNSALKVGQNLARQGSPPSGAHNFRQFRILHVPADWLESGRGAGNSEKQVFPNGRFQSNSALKICQNLAPQGSPPSGATVSYVFAAFAAARFKGALRALLAALPGRTGRHRLVFS